MVLNAGLSRSSRSIVAVRVHYIIRGADSVARGCELVVLLLIATILLVRNVVVDAVKWHL